MVSKKIGGVKPRGAGGAGHGRSHIISWVSFDSPPPPARGSPVPSSGGRVPGVPFGPRQGVCIPLDPLIFSLWIDRESWMHDFEIEAVRTHTPCTDLLRAKKPRRPPGWRAAWCQT